MIKINESTYEATRGLLLKGITATLIAITTVKAQHSLIALAKARGELKGTSEAFGSDTTLAAELAMLFLNPLIALTLAALLFFSIRALTARSAAPKYYLKTIPVMCLAILAMLSLEYEKAHYYTNETYNGGICGRSVVVWMHRLEGYSMNPKEEILARRGRQYFFGPHAFDQGTPYSRLDGPLPQRDPNPLAEDADTAEAPQDISE